MLQLGEHMGKEKLPYERFRETDLRSGIACDYFQRDTNCTTSLVHPAGWPQILATQGFYRSLNDVVTPGFSKRSAAGEVIINKMSYFEKELTVSGNYSLVRSTSNSCNSPVKHWGEDVTGPYALYASTGMTELSPVSLISDFDVKLAIDAAATAAWKDSTGSDAGILTDLAEMHQTLNMLRNPFSALSGLLRAINARKRSAISLGRGASVTAQNLWLQYRYGIRPLVSSVKSIIEALGKSRDSVRHTYRGKYRLYKQQTSTVTGGNWSTTFPVQDSVTDEVVVRAGVLIEEVVDLATSLGVTAGGMLATPWELIPFSFVADWFINVGDFLSSLQPYVTKSPKGTWYTVTRTRTRNWKISGACTAASGWSIERPATGEWNGIFTNRDRYYPLPGPSLTLKPQSLSRVIGDLRLIDSFALASQQLGRLFKG